MTIARNLFALLLSLSMNNLALSNETSDCPTGIYKGDHTFTVKYLKQVTKTKMHPAFVFPDGQRGLVDPATNTVCTNKLITFGDGEHYEYTQLEEKDIWFFSQQTRLRGRLLLVDDNPSVPLVVIVHGSESSGMVGSSYMPYMLAAQGLNVFFYDKRGTGYSDGEYTQDFELLAADASTAMSQAKLLLNNVPQSAGFIGFSQGGWVAPMAARLANADFITVAYGLMLSPVEEDAEQVYKELIEYGFSGPELSHARLLTDAAAKLVSSRFTEGQTELISLRKKYSAEPWYKVIEGEFTGEILRASNNALETGNVGDLKHAQINWLHDPVSVLKTLDVRQVWLLAGEDREAPVELTRKRLLNVKKQGKDLTLFEFPDTDHGMIEFTENAQKQRVYTNYASGYFKLLADSAKGTFSGQYGNARRWD